MRRNKLPVIVALVGSLAFSSGARAADDEVRPWAVVLDGNGHVASMSYPNPPVGQGVIQLLELDIGADATATTGRLQFKSGVKRDMTKEEVAFYYTQLEGPKTVWNTLEGRNQVTKYDPAATPLPASLSGTPIRVIIKAGLNFFGTLSFDSARPGGFFLSVVGASGGPIRFENAAVHEVQVRK